MKDNKTFTIDGKESKLEIVGRKNDNEVYVFLHTASQGWFGRDMIYGLSYNLDKKEVVECDKFANSEKSHFNEFRSRWGLIARYEDTFLSINCVGPGQRGSNLTPYIEHPWNFKNAPLKPSERKDLEAVIETLRTSHIDFSQILPTFISYRDIKFEYVGEHPKEIVKRELEKIKGVYLHVRGAAGAFKAAYDAAEHPRVEDVAIIHNPSKLIIKREYNYNGKCESKSYTYEFDGGKIIKGWQPVFQLQSPVEDGVCFVYGETGTKFLDNKGNEMGEKIGFPNKLKRREGVFKDSSGKEIPYRYKIDYDNIVLDYKGNKVADIDKQGFLK